MSSQLLGLLGALAGAGSIGTAVYFVKVERKRAEDECRQRFEALREGVKMGEKK